MVRWAAITRFFTRSLPEWSRKSSSNRLKWEKPLSVELDFLDHPGNERVKNRVIAAQRTMKFRTFKALGCYVDSGGNSSRKMSLTSQYKLGVTLPPNMAVILHILQKSEERRFRVENRHGFKIAQNWYLTKCLNSQLFWKRKKRFVFEKVIFDIFGRFSIPNCT